MVSGCKVEYRRPSQRSARTCYDIHPDENPRSPTEDPMTTPAFASLEALATESPLDASKIPDLYRGVRRTSAQICAPLQPEDCCVQSMPDVSPTKWHLAHTTWFFETFVLKESDTGYRPLREEYAYLFNSYYNTVGPQHSRPRRGTLSRPTLAEVMEFRAYVDDAMDRLFATGRGLDDSTLAVLEQGLHHEQQHQELMLMDIKHVFSCNPLYPVYKERPAPEPTDVPAMGWIPFEGQLLWTGHESDRFAFDNESPRHREYIEAFEIADRLVTAGEYLEFIEDGGYARPELWLSDGWATVQAEGWDSPLYWIRDDGGKWNIMTLAGLRALEPSEPVCHVSYYEADAYARWRGCWLPIEGAWEAIADSIPIEGNFQEQGLFHPAALDADSVVPGRPSQLFGDVWEWTCSPYAPYPGYRPVDGALGEYNGKFMCNQMVLRGGACVTPASHMRPTYRNFFPPDARWPFTGIRLTRAPR